MGPLFNSYLSPLRRHVARTCPTHLPHATDCAYPPLLPVCPSRVHTLSWSLFSDKAATRARRSLGGKVPAARCGDQAISPSVREVAPNRARGLPATLAGVLTNAFKVLQKQLKRLQVTSGAEDLYASRMQPQHFRWIPCTFDLQNS